MTAGIQVAVAALREPLEQVGFRKRAGHVFTMELSETVLAWLGLNHASRHRQPGEVEVNPVIGVRHQTVERLVAELREEEFHAYQPPTVSTPLGYLMPEHRYTAWIFGSDEASAPQRTLAAAVEEYGLPFVRGLSDLPAIRDALERGLGHYVEYRLPVVLASMGEHEEANRVLVRAIEELHERHDPAAKRLRQFADAFHRSELASGLPAHVHD